jgi:hypothetical protein
MAGIRMLLIKLPDKQQSVLLATARADVADKTRLFNQLLGFASFNNNFHK